MPVEKSSPSRTASEKAVRRSAPLISSAIEISEFQMTVSVMGSIWRLASLDIVASPIDFDHQVAEMIHLHDIAGKNDGRRFALLDQTRPRERLARLHPVAVYDLARGYAAELGKIGFALAGNG